MGLYRPEGGFRVLTEAEEAERVEHVHWARRYAVLSTVGVVLFIVLLVKHRWWHALFMWVMANVMTAISRHYQRLAKELDHE